MNARATLLQSFRGKMLLCFTTEHTHKNRGGFQVIDHIRNIQGVKIACLFEEIEPELTRVSLRSKVPELDVSTIAVSFGGGGHLSAAGARIPGKQMTIQRQVLAAVKKSLAASNGKA